MTLRPSSFLPRFLASSALLLLAATSCFASEGKTVLHFASGDYIFLFVALVSGLISIGIGFYLLQSLMATSPGSEKMQSVGKAIREGALAYLQRQITTMSGFVALLAIGLFALFMNSYGTMTAVWIAVCFVFGVSCSYLAGYSGMIMAVNGNMRTANAALTSYRSALEIAFRSGSVTGLMTVGLGLFGASIIFLLGGADAMKLLVGFGFGSSLAALFMRVGGGIFTKAADVGADLVGKVEAGIPEDDPRNPAVIADNVGDNVGDCAGMAADVFESYTVTLVASIILAAATAAIFDPTTWMRLVIFVLTISSLGILGSIVGIFAVRGSDDPKTDPMKQIRRGFMASAGVALVGTAVLSYALMGGAKSPIQTNKLVSFEQVHRDDLKKIVDAKKAIAKRKGISEYEVSQQDLDESDELKNLGLSDDAKKTLVPEGFGFREETAPTLKDVSNFRPVDFDNGSDPVNNYTVADPSFFPQSAADQPTFVSLREAYAERKGNHFIPKKLGAFKVRITSTQINPSTGKPMDPQTRTVGPMLKEQLDNAVKIANQNAATRGMGTVSLEYVNEYPATLYEDSTTGALAVGIDGEVDSETLSPAGVQFFRVGAGVVRQAQEKAKSDPSKPAALPPQETAQLAVVRHASAPWWLFLLPVAIGIGLAFGIEQITNYYVSTNHRPTKEVAKSSTSSAATLIIGGFSYGLESSVFVVLSIVIALMSQLWIFPPAVYGTYLLSFFGIALVGCGLLSTTGFILAMDTFGPISDNAQGVYEMSGETDPKGSMVVAKLDAAGNTTKALTKGFAIATAVVASVALFHSFLEDAQLSQIGLRLDLPEIFLGLLIGGAAPYLFSAFSINAVGRAAMELIREVRAQFKADPGIMKGTSLPNYAKCVSIVTAAAQRELLAPGILAICLPILVGFGFSIGKAPIKVGDHWYSLSGVQALGGFLAGAILSGQLMAVLLANAGGIWDNAKKLIEDGLYGGKGSEAHKASVIGDTVGDPFKDTAGPALNPLIKVMNLISLLMAPTFILPLQDGVLVGICLVALALLGFSIHLSKKTTDSPVDESPALESA